LVKAQYANAFGDDIVDSSPGHVDHVAAICVFFLMLRRLISTIAASKTIGTQWKATCACFSQTLLFVVGLLKQPFQILHLED